jgi:hypothetical protein
MPPGTGLPFLRLLRLAGLWWRYSSRRSHMSSLYNFRKNRIEIATSNSASIIMCLFVVTSLFVAAETSLASRCLPMDVSAVLLWLHTSGVQASCHNIFRFNYIYLWTHFFTDLYENLCKFFLGIHILTHKSDINKYWIWDINFELFTILRDLTFPRHRAWSLRYSM